MYTGSKKLKTFWATRHGKPEQIEVTLEGSNGDNCGYVRSIETGETWMTYGYRTLPAAGEIIMKFEYVREAS